MKTKALMIAAAMLASVGMMACSTKDVMTNDQKELPQAAQTTIAKYYSDVNIAQIKIDKETMGTDYEVLLTNGTQIEFDNAGAIKEVKAGINDTVPSAFVPAPIIAYVNANYPQQKVIQIDFGKKDTEITLSTGIELQFDQQGNFIKID